MDDYQPDPNYPSLNHLDLTTQTYHVLREQILKRQIKPGEKISIEAIANSLGVSRTPVVNALKFLEGDGLVEIIPRRGTFVTELTARDAAELFEIRLLIELYAAEQLFKTGKFDQALTGIEADIERMKSSIADEEYVDYNVFIAADRSLHSHLVSILDNRRMDHIYNDLNIHMRIARAHYLNTVESAREAEKEHEAMAEAIRLRDLEGLKKALCDHINTVKTRILELLEERGGKL
jgi:DNA-binding GntR family transcriptional regulator